MSRLSVRARLRVAAGLSLLPLGLPWGSGPGPHLLGAQVPARVLLVSAAAVLVVASARNRAYGMKRAVRVAAGAAGVALALALAAQASAATACLVAVAALLFPLIRPRKPGVFVPAQVRR